MDEEVTARFKASIERQRRRRRVIAGVVGLLVAGVGVAFGAWAAALWYSVLAAAFAVLLLTLILGAVPDSDADLEPVDVLAVQDRDVVVRNRRGQRLRWRTRRPAPTADVVGWRAWATAPVRRFQPSTLVVEEAGQAEVRLFAPTNVALFDGSDQPAVIVEADDDDREARIRDFDPVALLTTAQDAAAQFRRRFVLSAAGWAGFVVLGLVGLGRDEVTFVALLNGVMPALLAIVLMRGQIAGVGDLRRCERLELVEADARPFDADVHVRCANGAQLSWAVEAERQLIPLRGPLWVTAPVVAGRRITVVLPDGRRGARFVGAISRATVGRGRDVSPVRDGHAPR